MSKTLRIPVLWGLLVLVGTQCAIEQMNDKLDQITKCRAKAASEARA